MTTEVEAKEKWCPFIQVAIDGPGVRLATNRGHVVQNKDPVNLKCVGSSCMAWRWQHWRNGPGTGSQNIGKIEDKYVEPCDPPKKGQLQFYIHEGFCGLAGTP